MLADVANRIDREPRRVRVVHAGTTIADTTSAIRVFEGERPPAYYVPRDDVLVDLFRTETATTCPWKGAATYWSLPEADDVAWTYEEPLPEAAELVGLLAFYASRVDECWVGDERVTPEPSSYLGGWIVP